MVSPFYLLPADTMERSVNSMPAGHQVKRLEFGFPHFLLK